MVSAENVAEQHLDRTVVVPEKVWDSIVSIVGSAFFEWPNDKDVIRVMQWMKEKD